MILKQLRNLILFGALFLSPLGSAKADDIYKGVRGPTNFQIDERVQYSKNENNIESLTNNFILKYWDGDKVGKFAFVSLPYKLVNSYNSSNQGFGDVTIGAGPRGKIKNLHYFLYGASTLPTGNSKLSNKRYDIKAGTFITYLTKDKKFEIDGALEYNFTGKNNSGINPSNELYFSVLSGGVINNKIRFATGITDLIKDNKDFALNSRSVLRYTFSPRVHLEVVGDVGLKSKNIPKSNSLGIYLRYNF